MSKTIEIASRHTGPVSVKVKGESRTIRFQPVVRDGKTYGLANVDHDEASALLPLTNDFWKPGSGHADTEAANKAAVEAAAKAKADSDAKTRAEEEAGGESDEVKAEKLNTAIAEIAEMTNFNGFKAAVKKCDNLNVLKAVIASEAAKDEPKQNRLDVLNERIAEL